MRIIFLGAVIIMIVSSCSVSKYTASFKQQETYVPKSVAEAESPSLMASADSEPVMMPTATSARVNIEPTAITSTELSRREGKAIVRKLRSELKTYATSDKRQMKEVAPQEFEWDNDLKLAAIFGAAGLVGILLGSVSTVFSIIGGIALIIGVVFFVQWVIRQ